MKYPLSQAVFFVLLWAFPVFAFAAVTVDGHASSGDTSGTASTLTISVTPTSGDSLYVCGSENSHTATMTATWNGVAMTEAAHKVTPDNGSVYAWYADNVSGTHNVVISASTAVYMVGNVTYFGGVATPSLGATSTTSVDPAGSSLSGNLTTTAANSAIMDCLTQNGNGAQTATATGSGHTKDLFHYTSDGEAGAAGSTPATTVTSYTVGYSSSPDEIMGLALMEVLASGGGGGGGGTSTATTGPAEIFDPYYVGASTTFSVVDNPTQDFFMGMVLFLTSMFGILYLFKLGS